MNTSKIMTRCAVVCGALFVSIGGSQLNAQTTESEFVPFQKFLERTRTADSAEFSRSSRVTAFNEMRGHILKTYRGVRVSHSFVRDSSYFDCVPMMQQPAVRELGLDQIAEAPPASLLNRTIENNDPAAEGPVTQASLAGEGADEFGNARQCAAGTVPMQRVTLEDMTRFGSLQEFFAKGPAGAGRPMLTDNPAVPAALTDTHKYSRMYQTVDNLGGNSNLNIWSPYVDTSRGQVFTLAQEWYLGGSGNSMQTVEVGWQNYPQLYGSQKARLFIYYTADAYQTTGCYNLSCGAFVQVSSSMPVGADFGSAYSQTGGTQYEISAQFLLHQGNWWLSVQGTWIGYYPGSLFRGGQLTRFAQQIQYGTESTASSVWPAEGSGQWSTAGYGKAAYQRNLYHFNTAGSGVWSTLTQWISSPTCYTVAGPYSFNSPGWNVYFYNGGPGGTSCQ